jgi:hypothetical protein
MLKISVLHIQMGLKKSLFLKEMARKRPFSQRQTAILDASSIVKTAIFLLEMPLK